MTGGHVSAIDGTLTATGSVLLVNPNGVIVGPDGVVETGGDFIASTRDVLDADFLNGGDLAFTGTVRAAVVNLGRVSSLGGDVAFIAHEVRNEGRITAAGGTAALVAGTEVLLRDAALDGGKILVKAGAAGGEVTQAGIIRAAATELRAHDGNVYALAGETGGVTQAVGAARHEGRIFLTAEGGSVTIAHEIQARRDAGPAIDGGEVRISADFVAVGAAIDVDGAEGGTVDIEAGTLSLAEPVSARGLGGAGGTVAIQASGDSLVYSTGSIDVSGATEGGSIRHVTGRTLTHSGRYLATGANGKGGAIDIGGGAARLLSPTIDASGKAGGGRIHVGGEFQGGKDLAADELPNSLRLAATDATRITADATGAAGDGGRIILWGDERAAVLGTISARPGSLAGAGGFVEISSAGELVYRAEVATGRGDRHGTVLLDPKNFTIAEVDFNQSIFILGAGYSYPDLAAQLDNDDIFGLSVALDGTRLAVGAPEDDGQGNSGVNFGAVHLFSFIDQAFSGGVLEATLGAGYVGGKNLNLAARLNNDDWFGYSVSLDGARLAVGAALDDGQGNVGVNNGAVHLFSFTDQSFSGGVLEATLGDGYASGKSLDLAARLDPFDSFGWSVSLDGARLAVGAAGDDGASNGITNGGAVYLFSFADQAFSGGVLEATLGEGYVGAKNLDLAARLDVADSFGSSVSLDGTRLAVGAWEDDGESNGSSNAGAVYLFGFADGAFSGGVLEATLGEGYAGGKNLDLAASLDMADVFGTSVSLDGARLAVGAVGDHGQGNGGFYNGAVYLFSFADTAFSGGVLEATLGEGYAGGKSIDLAGRLDDADSFGGAVSLDGTRLGVGVAGDEGQGNGGTDIGAVHLFSFTDMAFSGGVLEATIGEGYDAGGKNLDLAAELDTGDTFGISVSLDEARLAVGSFGDDGQGNGGNFKGAVHLFRGCPGLC